MGEEAKQEEAKPEEKVEESKKEENIDKKSNEEEPKPPPQPLVLFVDLHCVGCAKKIERSIMRIRGVEGVAIDMAKNEVTIKGIVEPQAVCNKIMKKTKRITKVLSPLPASEGEPIPELVTSQVSGPITIELNVNMHCEACAEQLKTKILKMRGVQTATTELSSGKVTVTGTMDANKLVEYVYRRTKKQAKIVPQPEPEPQLEPENKKEETKEEPNNKPEEAKKEDEKPVEEEAKKEDNNNGNEEKKEESHGDEGKKEEIKKENNNNNKLGQSSIGVINPFSYVPFDHHEEENMKRRMYYYQPLYMIDRIPPPQLFSDENPNACCIS